MKKFFYLVLWIFLGLILSFIFHSLIEMIYLGLAQKNDWLVTWTLSGDCALPMWLVIGLPILGVIFGLWCGFIAWRKIYIEKVRGDHPNFFRK